MTTPLAVSAILVLLLAAGCVTPTQDEPTDGGVAVATERSEIEFGILAGAYVALVGAQRSDPKNGDDVEVPLNTSELFAIANWTCQAGPCRLTLVFRDPAGDVEAESAGDGSATLTVRDPEAGTWNIAMFADGAATRASGTITIVVARRPVAPEA